MSKSRFTPVKQKMVDCLKSGSPTKRECVWRCLWDEAGDVTNIHFHLSQLRTQLKTGYEIICQLIGRSVYYRIIRVLQGEDPFSDQV